MAAMRTRSKTQQRTAAPDEPEKEAPAFRKPGFRETFVLRAQTATLMMLTFMAIVWAGHFYVWLLIVALQTMSFRELLVVRYREYKASVESSMPLFRTLQWGWFLCAMFYVYSDFIHQFALEHDSASVLLPLSRYWEAASFAGYCAVFTTSVWTLGVDSVKYQVGQLSWTIVTLCIVVGQMKFVAHNIFEGLFWFFFPVWLVINNDCWAYLWGVLLGKRFVKKPFFRLSPKKTWEGFLGAAVSTVIVAYHTAPLFAKSRWLACPATKLTLAWHEPLDCAVGDAFVVRETLPVAFGFSFSNAAPIQLHAVCFGLFASVVAPFGGFLASAIKRAYEIKDFDSLIPGHGGITDRVDCEFIMALFVYVYHKTFIKAPGGWQQLATAAGRLPPDEQRLLLDALGG